MLLDALRIIRQSLMRLEGGTGGPWNALPFPSCPCYKVSSLRPSPALAVSFSCLLMLPASWLEERAILFSHVPSPRLRLWTSLSPPCCHTTLRFLALLSQMLGCAFHSLECSYTPALSGQVLLTSFEDYSSFWVGHFLSCFGIQLSCVNVCLSGEECGTLKSRNNLL